MMEQDLLGMNTSTRVTIMHTSYSQLAFKIQSRVNERFYFKIKFFSFTKCESQILKNS